MVIQSSSIAQSLEFSSVPRVISSWGLGSSSGFCPERSLNSVASALDVVYLNGHQAISLHLPYPRQGSSVQTCFLWWRTCCEIGISLNSKILAHALYHRLPPHRRSCVLFGWWDCLPQAGTYFITSKRAQGATSPAPVCPTSASMDTGRWCMSTTQWIFLDFS